MSQPIRTVLRGGTIVDGTSALPIPGEVAVVDDRITSVGKFSGSGSVPTTRTEDNVIDCTGCIIAPGFIDAHSHSDLQVLDGRTEKLLQGVTAEVVGNCGFSPYPLSEPPQLLREFANGIFSGDDDHWGWKSASDYLDRARRSSVATVASLVGHGSLRIKVAGNTCRALSARELDTMTGMLDDALQEGAIGLSSGLMYAPGSGASPEELTALCRLVARRGAVYATHMRNYSAELVEAVEEQISIAETSGCRLQISHLQAVGHDNWPLQERAIAAIEQAAARGVDVGFDAYPWLAGSTVLTQLLPQTALEGGISGLLGRLNNPVQRNSIRTEMEREHGAQWNDLVISYAQYNPTPLVGKSIQDIAAERGTNPSSAVLDILIEQQGNANILEYNQSIENLRALLTHPLAIVVTDGLYTKGRPHPRLYGTFPLLLGSIVRERGWLTIEAAIHKISGQPAMTFNLRKRGRIAEGYIADLTVFDPKTVDSGATYDTPTVQPTGIHSVFRNGKMVVRTGAVV